MDKKLKRWKLLAAGLLLALALSGYVCYRQNATIQMQRNVIILLWNDFQNAVSVANHCISRT
jgi:hypothetical protein